MEVKYNISYICPEVVYFKDQLNLSCNELLKTTNAKTIFLFYSLQLIFKKSMATGKKKKEKYL